MDDKEIKIDSTSQKRIEERKEMIQEAIQSNNSERLKGILQVCMIDTDISEKDLDELANFVIRVASNELSEEEVEKITGGRPKQVMNPIQKASILLLTSLGVLVTFGSQFNSIKQWFKKKKNKGDH